MFLHDDSPLGTSDLCVQKRDGKTIVPFNRSKIAIAIRKAFESSGETFGDLNKVADDISELVFNDIMTQRKLNNCTNPISIEDIQNHVEIALMLKGYYTTAKKFIIYRQKRSDARELTIEKFISLIDEYLANDYKENSNMDYSLQGLNNFVTTKVMTSYWLNKVLSPDMKNAHLTGDLHIHDLNLLSSYCSGWDLRDLLLRGFGGVAGTNSSGPAKHFETVLGQVWNFLYSMQGEAAGAQALSNFDTFLAPFIRHDKLDYKEVKQNFQKFFHNMTTKTRVGFQAPFTNVSMDLTVPVHMANDAVIIGGKLTDSTYGEYQHEMDLFNRAFCEVMLEGDYEGRQFPFPIPNYNITADFDWDNPVLDTLWKLTGKYGSPYFTNFVNSDMKPEDVRSMCPLHPDEKLHIRMNGHYVIMRIEDIYKNLSHRTFSGVFVRCRGEEIEVDQVVRNNPKGFIKICTDLDPDGIIMDYTHQQPIRNKTDDIEYMVVSAKSLKNIKNFYVPYSVTGYENNIPKGTFVSNGFLWVPITEVEDMGLMCNHSYCISVKSEEALFEMGPGKLVTHNCRLKLDNRVLRKRGGGLFGANPLTGSIGVVTINLPKLGYKFKGNKEAFYTELSRLMDMSAQMLYDKRLFIEAMMKKGLYPFMRTYMQQIYDRFEQYFFNHFSTIGVIGGNECALNFMGKNIVDSEGKEFVKEILNFARDRMLEYQDKYGCPFNLEATPAEGVTQRLAKLDVNQYPDIVTAISHISGAETPYYTNSTQLPVDHTSDIFEACDHQNELQPLYTGGTVLHLLLGEEVTDINVVKNLIRTVCTNYEVPYVTLSPKYSVCVNHGYLAGEVPTCPSCSNETEVYARVVGFYTPVKRWNTAKREEFKHRADFDPESIN